MKHTIIGRIAEMEILEQLLKSDRPGLLAIYGRRRVGKTYLIKNYYAGHLKFACSGECGGSLRTQLANFQQQLNTWFPTNRQLQAPANWQQAFIMLRECLDTVKTKGKKVIFFLMSCPGSTRINRDFFLHSGISGIYTFLTGRIYSR